jgi:hypothetical protein
MQHAHGAGALPCHRGDLIDVEPGQIAQQDDLALVDRQGAQPGNRGVEGPCALGLPAPGGIAQLGQLGYGQRLPRRTAVVVERSSPALVKSQPRNAASSPRNRWSRPADSSQTSEATSSHASPHIARR